MKRITIFSLLTVLSLLLAACSSTPTTAPVSTATVRPTPPALPTLSAPEDSGDLPTDIPESELLAPYQAYYNADGDFSLALPIDWSVNDPQDSPLGKMWVLGADPEAPGASTIYVADPAKVTADQAVKTLCEKCAGQPEVTSAKLNGMDARHFQVTSEENPPVDWWMVEHNNKLLIFSLQSQDTFESMDAVLQSFTFGKQTDLGIRYGLAAMTAQQIFGAEIAMDPYSVVVTDIQAKQWPDSCLGAPDEGEECDPTVTPGYLGTLDARGITAEFHSNEDGSQVRTIPGAAMAAKKKLADEQKIDAGTIRILVSEEVDWADACLELGQANESCEQSLTPGYRVVLLVGDKKYEFHTNLKGDVVRQAPEVSE